MKKQAVVRVGVAVLMLANSVVWAIMNGPATSSAIVGCQSLSLGTLLWGISALISFVLFLTHALTSALSRDLLTSLGMVPLVKHETLQKRFDDLQQQHQRLRDAHTALQQAHETVQEARTLVMELEEAPVSVPETPVVAATS